MAASRYWCIRYIDKGNEFIANVMLPYKTMDAVQDYCIQVKHFDKDNIIYIRPARLDNRIVLHGTHCEDDSAYHH